MLVLYPPSRVDFYPACPVREYLHLECPGCGATRALAALLRGHLIDALRLNALFTTLLPVALAGAIESYGRALRSGVFRWPQIPDSALFTALGATGVFTILRNLPL